MEETEKNKRNEAIALFMGKRQMYEATHQLFINSLKYHSSWDWLMPVVEKIEEQEEIDRNKSFDANGTVPRYCTPYRVDIINRNQVEILAFGEDLIAHATGKTKIEAVFLAVSDYCLTFNKD